MQQHLRALAVGFALAVGVPARAKPKQKHPTPPPTPSSSAPAAVPTSAVPQGVESDLVKQALAAFEEPDYERAILIFQQALKEDLTRVERIVTHRTLGFCHAALGDERAAREDFENLLRLDPDAELDRTVAPRVRALFEQARSAAATTRPTEVSGLPEAQASFEPMRPSEGRPLAIRIESPISSAARVQLFHRRRGADLYSRIEALASGNGFVATVPALAVRAPAIEYYVEVTDSRGVPVARVGTLGSPVAVAVEAVKTPIYKKGWFWGVLGGVVAVGAGIAVAVILTRPSVSPGTPAAVTFQPF